VARYAHRPLLALQPPQSVSARLESDLRVLLRCVPVESTVALWDSQDGRISSGLARGHDCAVSPVTVAGTQSGQLAAESGDRKPLLYGSRPSSWEMTLPDKVTGPLGPRRSIAAALKQLREESGKNLNEVAEDLMISTSKLSRLENAQGKPQARDIRDLIQYYEIRGTPLAGSLQRWVTAAQRQGWWTDFDDEVLGNPLGGLGLDAHLGYEADAKVERIYTLPFVPALLQTREYAEAIFRDMEHRTEDEIDQLLDVRARRQQALSFREGLAPLRLIAVTHESSLRQAVGSPEVLRNQLDALVERSKAENVSLHVLPFEARPVFTMTCMYAYFEYQDADLEQDVVNIETPAGYWSIENPAKVAQYRKAHDALVKASLDEDESRALIRSHRDDVRSGL
jgi:transcriptional regulator with XRE-family HTH domain